MDNFKKIASLSELEALKNLIHYENSGEHKPIDKREKILVDFTNPKGKIKSISESSTDTGLVAFLCKGSLPETEEQLSDYIKELKSTVESLKGNGTEYFELLSCPDSANIPCRKFFEIYAHCAIALKQEFPDIKVGAGSFQDCVSDYVHEFMNYLALDKRIPLDFFSWKKSVTKSEQLQNYIYAARTLLDKYEFSETDNIITAWQYNSKSSPDAKEAETREAAFVAATLISLQKTPVDIALYGKENFGKNNKVALAFDAFCAISSLGIEVTSDSAADHVYVVGAKNDDKGVFMLANFNPYEKLHHELVFDLKGVFGKKCEIYLLDEEHDLELVYSGEIPESYNMGAESVVLVKLV
ncbi:MAG: hypothetical protein IKI97_12365 [Clostridia bacterium]|nr:hypothetical protein [Clostridia bacterium]